MIKKLINKYYWKDENYNASCSGEDKKHDYKKVDDEIKEKLIYKRKKNNFLVMLFISKFVKS